MFTQYKVTTRMVAVFEVTLLFIIAIILFVFLTTCGDSYSTLNLVLILVALVTVLILLRQNIGQEQQAHIKEGYTEKRAKKGSRAGSNETRRANASVKTDNEITELPKTNLQININSFDSKSYNGQGKDVRNISPSATSKNMLFTFDEAPIYSSHSGFSLHNKKLRGPLSMDLGIAGNKPYSISWFMQLNEVSGRNAHPIFNLRANTMQNIGLSVRLKRVSSSEVQIHIQHSDDEVLIYTNNKFTDPFIIMDKQFHLFTLVRDVDKIQLFVDDYNAPILDGKLVDTNVLFSNKEIEINPTGKLNMNLALFAVYNASLSVNEISTIYRYVQGENIRKTDVWESLHDKYVDIVNSIKKDKQCAFQDYTICHDKCGNVKDWSDPVVVLRTATDDCIRSIIEHCNKPEERDKQYCGLWNKSILDRLQGLSAKPQPPKKKRTPLKGKPAAAPPVVHDATGLRHVTAEEKRLPDYDPQTAPPEQPQELSAADIELLLKRYKSEIVSESPIALLAQAQQHPSANASANAKADTSYLNPISAMHPMSNDQLIQTVMEKQKNKSFFSRMLSSIF
jgi:hypothetical protein